MEETSPDSLLFCEEGGRSIIEGVDVEVSQCKALDLSLSGILAGQPASSPTRVSSGPSYQHPPPIQGQLYCAVQVRYRVCSSICCS